MTPDQEKHLSKAIGALIAQARARAKMTQEEVALALDVGPETISRIERGAVPPTVARLFEFAELFGCRVDDLLLEASDRSADLAAVIATELVELAPADRQMIANVVVQLAEHLRKKHGKPKH
jgi:transcriptional regulator with XRE-family HTH domain